MKKELILVGGGGHCRSCIDVIERAGEYQIEGIVDLPEKVSGSVLGYPIVGSDRDLADLAGRYTWFFITIGQIRSAEKRVDLFHRIKQLKVGLPLLVSPSACVSPRATLGEGTIVMHGAVVNACARIGANCIINTGAVVEHDAVVESHCHISTGAVVNGGALIHERTFIGSQAMIREGIVIGESCFIGAGSRVKEDVDQGQILKA